MYGYDFSLYTACPAGYYGVGCLQECMCSKNSTCNPVTGQCECLAGWIGPDCSQSKFFRFIFEMWCPSHLTVFYVQYSVNNQYDGCFEMVTAVSYQGYNVRQEAKIYISCRFKDPTVYVAARSVFILPEYSSTCTPVR